MSKTGQIGERTASSIQSNRIYKEGFVSNTWKCKESVPASVTVCKGTTLETAKKYCRRGRVAVLNFANPEFPGGGVQNGAMAQEECLCRSSNLYACISHADLFEEYYAYHRNLRSNLYTDRLIYTKNILVFKNDEALPVLMPVNEWFYVDVITCAAPYMGAVTNINAAELLNVFKNRIKNIFEAAKDNYADIIVLGAFGCGAFKNPPKLVANAFYQVIFEQEYFKDFKEIVFAIKPTGDQCPNFAAFSSQFSFLDSIGRNRLGKFVGTIIDERYLVLKPLPPKGINQFYMVYDALEYRSLVMEVKDIQNQKYSREILEVILEEFHIWKQMKHPAIPFFDCRKDANHMLIFREYVEGTPLNMILEENGAMPVPVVIEYVRQLCNVLNYLHEQMPPYIYGSMKPSDIMVKTDGKLMLINWGTAREDKLNQEIIKREGYICVLGIRGYSAPECWGGQIDARTDIYSLGAVMYYMLTGYAPDKPPYTMYPIRQINPEFPKKLEKIVWKCTQLNPHDRYQSCAELLDDLEKFSKRIPESKTVWQQIYDKIFWK